MRTYTTVQGDMWDSIAHAQLGGAKQMGALLRANPDLRGYYIFPAGVVLKLPEVEENVTPALPPWKREPAI